MGMIKLKLKELVYNPILGEWGKEESESPLGNGIINVIRTANFLPTGKIDYSDITKRAVLKKKKTESGDIWVADENKIENKQLKHKDLIIERSGGGPKTPVGRVVIFESNKDETYLCSNFLSVLRPKEDVIIPEYLLYQFRYLYQISKVKKYQNQTTGIYNLKLGRYLDVEIDLPPKSDQSIVVAQLSKIQEFIDKRVKIIRFLDEYMQSLFLESFGDPVINDKDLKEEKLSDLLELNIDYRGKTPPKSDEGIPLISSANIKKGEIDFSVKQFISEVDYSEWTVRGFVEENDVLITTEAPAGEVALYPKGKHLISRRVIALRPKEGINNTFLYFLMRDKNWNKRVREKKIGSTVERIRKNHLLSQKIICPKIDEQDKFEQKYLLIKSLKTKCRQSLRLLENLFEVTLHNAFSIEEIIDEEKLFEDIIQDFKVDDFKKGQRIQYLINWLKKDKKKELFSDIEKYNLALENLFLLLEDASIEQYLDGKEIKLNKAL